MWAQHVLEGVSLDAMYLLFDTETNCIRWLEQIVENIVDSNWDEVMLEIKSCERNNHSFDPAFWHPDFHIIQTMLTLHGPKRWIYFLTKEISTPRFFWTSWFRTTPCVNELKEKFVIEQELIKHTGMQ